MSKPHPQPAIDADPMAAVDLSEKPTRADMQIRLPGQDGKGQPRMVQLQIPLDINAGDVGLITAALADVYHQLAGELRVPTPEEAAAAAARSRLVLPR